jgi:hypothetical protein
MSPEQVNGGEAIDGRSDIFSAGVLLYELLAGRKPFKGETPTATIIQILREEPPPLGTLAPGLPPQLVAAVGRALAKEPAGRFATAGEFARELQLIRRTLQNLRETTGLDETRFASQAEMQELQAQLDKDAAARAQSVAPPRNRRWIIPAGLAAAALIGMAALTLGGPGAAVERGATPTTNASAAIGGGGTPAVKVLRVETVPAGAEVVLDGRPTGEVTPAPLTLSGAGPHTLRLSKRGFVAQDVRLTDADLARGTLTYTLAAVEVQRVPVTITSPYPVEVLNGSQTVGAAALSHHLTVPAGSRLRVVAREVMLDSPITVSGKGVQYSAPPIGRLTVLTKFETCNVKIGDRLLGFPPITRMQIVAGQYRVDIVCQGGNNPPSQFVTVPANDTATVRIH